MSATPADIRPSRPWRTTFIAGMASYLDAGAITTLGTAVVLYRPTLGLTDGDVGALAALLTLCFAIGSVFGGRLGDRFGRRRVFTVTLLIYIVGAALMMTAAAAPMLYVGVVLMGLAVGADLPVSLALIAEEAPEGKKGKMVTVTSFLWMLGGIVPSLLTAGIASLGETAARILYGQLLVIAIIVVVLRLGLRESAEWTAAKKLSSAELLEGTDHAEITFSHVFQLFRRPMVFTVVALGLYYGIWGLAGNTFGQFSSFIWVEIAGLPLEAQAILGLATLPLGILAIFVFLANVDNPRRRTVVFTIGTVLSVVAFFAPAIFGLNIVTLTLPMLAIGIAGALSGETIYKVWSQELVPTLLRSTSQGITMAFARLLAAGFAVVTPMLFVAAPQVGFGVLGGCLLVAGAIGFIAIPRLPKATDLEPTAPLDFDADSAQSAPVDDEAHSTVPAASAPTRTFITTPDTEEIR